MYDLDGRSIRRHNKRLERLRNNPKNVRFEDIDALLTGLGFSRRQRGSHVVYSRPGVAPITVPIRKPFILPVYVKQIIACLDELADPDDDNQLCYLCLVASV